MKEHPPPCSWCTPPRLPLLEFLNLCWVPDPMPKADEPEKFQHFENLYGTDTYKLFRPSYMDNLDEDSKALFVKERAQAQMQCVSCSKPRVVYAEKKVWNAKKQIVEGQMENLHYICGSVLFEDGHRLHEKIVLWQMVKCSSNIEVQYYSSKIFLPVCYYCGVDRDFCAPLEHIKNAFQDVYPLCGGCRAQNKTWFTKRHKPGYPKWASGGKKRK